MTLILLHADTHRFASIEVKASTTNPDESDITYPLATTIAGTVHEIPGVTVTHSTYLGSLLDTRARVTCGAGKVQNISISCGTTENFEVYPEARPEGVTIMLMDAIGNVYDVDATPLIKLLTDQQKHFLTL